VNRRSRTWGLEVSTERVPGGIVLVPKGRIGSVTAPAFGDAVTAALAAAPRVVIDLSEIDYISGAGIGALQQAGDRVVVCGLHDAVRIALELSRAIDRLAVVKDRQEALESLITDH
jgi:anti-anti-sigma factor